MKNTYKNILLGVSLLTVFSCSAVDIDGVNSENGLPNAIYVDGVQSSPVKKVVVGENGAVTSFQPRTANLVKSDLELEFVVDAEVLNQYNAKFGTSYQVLPEDQYEMSATKVTIKAGSASDKPVDIAIKGSALDLDGAIKYAIPLRICDNASMPVLANTSYQIIVADRAVKTTAMRQEGFCIRTEFEQVELKEWTLHYCMQVKSWFANQQPVMSSFYSRITPEGKLQYKPGGSDDPKGFSKQTITPGKWFHVTYVYKNQHVKAYINGALEFELDVPSDNEKVSVVRSSYGNFRGIVRDIRLYKTALTEFQINESLYIEDPANPNLFLYTPLNQESGLKDVSGNGHDMKAFYPDSDDEYDESKIEWLGPYLFPEN